MPRRRTNLRVQTVAFGFHGGRGRQRPMAVADQHNEIEINLVEQGGMDFRRGTETRHIREGEATIYWAAVPHQVLAVRPSTRITWLVLPLAWFLSWKLPARFAHRLLGGEMLTLGPSQIAAQATFSQWADDLKNPDLRLAVRLEIEAFFRRLALEKPAGGSLAPAVAGHQYGHVERMVRLMTERFREPLTVAEIARDAGLAPEYAMRLFRQQWGVTVWSFLLQQRIAEARRLLVLGDSPLAEIGFACGFQSLGRFYQAFKTYCQCSPGAYRRQYAQASPGVP